MYTFHGCVLCVLLRSVKWCGEIDTFMRLGSSGSKINSIICLTSLEFDCFVDSFAVVWCVHGNIMDLKEGEKINFSPTSCYGTKWSRTYNLNKLFFAVLISYQIAQQHICVYTERSTSLALSPFQFLEYLSLINWAYWFAKWLLCCSTFSLVFIVDFIVKIQCNLCIHFGRTSYILNSTVYIPFKCTFYSHYITVALV